MRLYFQACVDAGIDGLIISNTTIGRPPELRSPNQTEVGGLSGAPLKHISTELIRDMYQKTKGESNDTLAFSISGRMRRREMISHSYVSACLFVAFPGQLVIIGVGGVETGIDAYDKIKAVRCETEAKRVRSQSLIEHNS